MAKAILVIDMPDGAEAEDYYMVYGLFANKGKKPFRVGEVAFKYEKVDLKPLPQKMNETEYMQKINSDGDWYEQVIGWNMCIEEITGDHIGGDTEKVGETE